MALAKKKATTSSLDSENDRLLSHAARERGVSRSEFIRQHLALVPEQYRRHPKPTSAGIVRALAKRGDERGRRGLRHLERLQELLEKDLARVIAGPRLEASRGMLSMAVLATDVVGIMPFPPERDPVLLVHANAVPPLVPNERLCRNPNGR